MTFTRCQREGHLNYESIYRTQSGRAGVLGNV